VLGDAVGVDDGGALDRQQGQAGAQGGDHGVVEGGEAGLSRRATIA
jgi:hypothetical protein